jgi:hypothetical protein
MKGELKKKGKRRGGKSEVGIGNVFPSYFLLHTSYFLLHTFFLVRLTRSFRSQSLTARAIGFLT